jgi:hypothetical protein
MSEDIFGNPVPEALVRETQIQSEVKAALVQSGVAEDRATQLARQPWMHGRQWAEFEMRHGEVARSSDARKLKAAHRKADWATFEAEKLKAKVNDNPQMKRLQEEKAQVDQWKADIAKSYWRNKPGGNTHIE